VIRLVITAPSEPVVLFPTFASRYAPIVIDSSRAPDSATLRALAAEWETIHETLLVAARRLSGSPDKARDLVHEAYLAIRTGRRTWDRDKDPDLARFVGAVMGSIWTHARSSAAARHAAPYVPGQLAAAPTSAPNPEELSVMKEDLAVHDDLLEELCTSLAEDGVARAIVDLALTGVVAPFEQAARLRIAIEDVYNARRRLRYAVEQLLERRQGDARKGERKRTSREVLPALVAQGKADDAVRDALAMSVQERARALAEDGFDVEAERARAKRMRRELEGLVDRPRRAVALRRPAAVLLLGASLATAIVLLLLGRAPRPDGLPENDLPNPPALDASDAH
jgi:DNA-directed RNA polymerase specialized sigma24 family protein